MAGKKYRAAAEKVDRKRRYPLNEAVALLSEMKISGKSDETIDVAVRLGVNPKHADQMVRGAVVLPHGTGKTKIVLCIAKPDKAKEALDAGADFAGGEEYVNKIKDENWFGFDAVVATPDMMGQVGKIGRVLGPRGLMPNPKVGTVTMDVKKAVGELKAGRVEFRVEKAGIVHSPIGKASFEAGKLGENLSSLMDTLLKLKPSTAKGAYVKSITISSTYGPGIKVDPSSFSIAK
ncbi:MAG: 50S ribosomal protein L1 [Myxococcales bacterium]|nr:50S ribosomal protein L1 [Myxococcales bacterium]